MNLIKKIIRKGFFRNLSILVSGVIVSQAIAMGAIPILTRLFTPENFGLFALFTSIVMIINRVSSLCYERAIILAPTKVEAQNVAVLSLILLVLVSFLTFVIILIFRDNFFANFEKSEFSSWIIFLPIGVFLVGLDLIFRNWRLRQKETKFLALSRVSGSAFSNLVKIVAGLFVGPHSLFLIFGFLFNYIVSIFVLSKKLKVRDWREHYKAISIDHIRFSARKYKSFPLFATWNALLVELAKNIPVFLFSALFSPVIVGYYSLCHKVLRAPIDILGQSINNLFFQKAGEAKAKNSNILINYKKISLALALGGIAPFTCLWIVAEPLISFVFGDEWATSGTYVKIMAPLYYFMLVRIPSNVIYEVFQSQRVKLFLSILRLIMTVLGVLVFYYMVREPRVIIGVFVWVNILVDIITCATAYKIIKLNE